MVLSAVDNVTYNAYHEKYSGMYGARGNNRLWITKVNIQWGPVKGVSPVMGEKIVVYVAYAGVYDWT